MATLFTPHTIGPRVLSNRIVVAPMCMYSAKGGLPSAFHEQHIGRLALSGAALVLIEATGVSAQGRISDRCLGLWSDEQEGALRQLLDRVRTYCDTPIGIQIGHAGRKASTSAPWINGGGPLPQDAGPWPVIGPSTLSFKREWPVPAAMDEAMMEEVIQQFTDTARRADRAGFDALELHAAHGYLLSSFLSGVANNRTDEYGGSLQNRMRFPLRVAKAVRDVWPRDKALGIRLNGSDWSSDGITPEEAAIFAKAIAGLDYDWLHISSGGNDPAASISATTGYQIPFAAQIKRENPNVTVIGVGLIKTPAQAEAIVRSKDTDLVAVGRAILANPNWPHAARAELDGTVDLPRQYERASLVSRERVS